MLIGTKELQNRLNIGRDTAYSLMHSEGFPSIRLSGRYYVAEKELEAWLSRYRYKSFKF